jgi:hypothetical protein
MSVYTEAHLLVAYLLEAMVRLLPPTMWTSFTALADDDSSHGRQQFIDRVDENDVVTFCEAMSRLVKNRVPIMVPNDRHWALKMPGGYDIFGQNEPTIKAVEDALHYGILGVKPAQSAPRR